MTLPDYIFSAFENIPTGQSINVLMRHSKRFPINNDDEVFTAQLTPEGEQTAKEYGEWIIERYKIGKIFSSPINRCMETGRYLAKGAGNGKVVIPEPVLGHPNENGEYNAMSDYMTIGKWPERITKIADLTNTSGEDPKLHLLITHDTVLALMAAYWLNLDIRAPRDWPNFLEPMFFWKQENNLIISFRGRKYVI